MISAFGKVPQHRRSALPAPDQSTVLQHVVQDAGDSVVSGLDLLSQLAGRNLLEVKFSAGLSRGPATRSARENLRDVSLRDKMGVMNAESIAIIVAILGISLTLWRAIDSRHKDIHQVDPDPCSSGRQQVPEASSGSLTCSHYPHYGGSLI